MITTSTIDPNQDGEPMNENTSGAGAIGVIKLFVAIAVFALGGLAILFVFDALPADLFQNFAFKIAASTVIAVVVAAAVALLSRSK